MTDPVTTTETPQTDTTTQPQAEPAATESLLAAEPAPEPAPAPFDITTFAWPEGAQPSDAQKTAFAELAKEHGISAKQASAFAEMHYGILKGVAAEQTAEWDRTVTGYADTTKAHYGAKLGEAQTKIEKLLDEYGDVDLRKQLIATGLGNHIAVWQFLEKLANAVGEGTPIVTNGGSAPVASGLAALYPSMVEK